jgi:TorA maturation chaperone TorD
MEREEDNLEPEDHVATLCEIMARLADGSFATPFGPDRQFFQKHMAPWIGRFFSDLERADSAEFYRQVGALGQVFITLESDAFALPG